MTLSTHTCYLILSPLAVSNLYMASCGCGQVLCVMQGVFVVHACSEARVQGLCVAWTKIGGCRVQPRGGEAGPVCLCMQRLHQPLFLVDAGSWFAALCHAAHRRLSVVASPKCWCRLQFGPLSLAHCLSACPPTMVVRQQPRVVVPYLLNHAVRKGGLARH